MIIRARSVVTMDGAPIDAGAVEVLGNRIAAVAPWRTLRASHAGEVVDLGECALLPGLINGHCHLDYTGLRDRIGPPESFTQWIQAINTCKAALTSEDYEQSIETGLAEAANFGTTTLANFEALPALLSRITPPPMRTWWFAEMLDLRGTVSATAEYEQLKSALPPLGQAGLAPHAPFTASAALYRAVAEMGVPRATHLAESREEMEMFREGRGPLFEFLRSIGRPMEDCGTETPLGLLLQEDVLDADWLVVHLNELTAGDFQRLERAPRFQIVHCPRSHAYFGHTPLAWERLRALGFNICVGTDSLASNHDLSLLAELRQLQQTEPSLSARELLETITIHAATALGQGDTLGRIRLGFVADLIALPCSRGTAAVCDDVVAYEGKTSWRMIDGVVRF